MSVPAVQSLAVLDLQNLSGRAEDDWMGSGIAESLTSDLARVPGLSVVSRPRVVKLARPSPGEPSRDALEIGSLLGCRWVLSGRFQRMGPAVRLTTQLSEVGTGHVVAGEKLDGTIDGIFEMQDRLSRAVLESLHLRLPTPTSPPVGEAHVQAFEYYLRRRRLFLRLEEGGFDQAREWYERAIAVDPAHAPALAGLAGIHAMRYTFTTDPQQLDLAAEYASRAAAADPLLSEPLVWLGYVQMRRGDLEGVHRTELRAEALDSSNSYPPYFAGCALVFGHRADEALALFQRAALREPPSTFVWSRVAVCHLAGGRLAEARWCLGEAAAIEAKQDASSASGVRSLVGECLRLQGRLEEARVECMAGLETVEQSDHMYRDSFRCQALCSLARTALDMGDIEAVRAALQQVIAHLNGRPRTLGGGFSYTQALAGLARAERSPERFDAALAFYRERPRLNFDHVFLVGEEMTLVQLALAARTVGRPEARALLEQARASGCYEAARLLEAIGADHDTRGWPPS